MKYGAKLPALAIVLLLISIALSSVAQDDRSKLVVMTAEPDWAFIRNAHFEVMDRLVSSPQKITQEDLESEQKFLALINMTRTQYLSKVELVKAAAKRLVRKYAVDTACSTCSIRDATRKLGDLLTVFRNNRPYYENYGKTVMGLGLDDEPTRCCGLRFYLCCTVCAATIAAFPAYLACCALCFDTYCCKP